MRKLTEAMQVGLTVAVLILLSPILVLLMLPLMGVETWALLTAPLPNAQPGSAPKRPTTAQ